MADGDPQAARKLSELVLNTLDAEVSAEDLSRQAFLSRSSYFRLFQAFTAEPPVAMRRRFLLERSAWRLGRTQQSVTEIALDAGYGSLEAFTRAFHRAYGISPSLYRRSGVWCIHLPSPNEFHYCGPESPRKGASSNMDLFDLFAGGDAWHTKRLLEHAAKLTDEQLDRPLGLTARIFAWDKPDQNLREILERMILTKEVWTAALAGTEMPRMENVPASDRTPAALLARSEKVEDAFGRFMREVRDRGAWDETFVDALCEPPEKFSFGGTFAHIITFNTYRRMMALEALQKLGAPMAGVGCPMEYESSLAQS